MSKKTNPACCKQYPIVRLSEFDMIVAAYARKASGPGWSNRPLWVIVEDRRTGKLREECIQPHQQSEEIWRLYDIAAEVDVALYAAVKRLLPTPGLTGGR
jgi:hypothetical protein